MSYLPFPMVEDTQFPLPFGADLRMQVRTIAELFTAQHPQVHYEVLIKNTQPVSDVNTLSGAAGANFFDVLWGEDVDSTRAATTGIWEQPHASGVAQAADVDVFAQPRTFHAQVQRLATDDDFKKFGYDSNYSRNMTLGVNIPLSFLDDLKIVVGAGDRMTWDGEQFVVLLWKPVRYFVNTNVRLYMKLILTHYRHGS